MSMAAGEFVSVSSQRDVERADIALERRGLETSPDDELAELAGIYRARGLSEQLAWQVARELSAGDRLAVHARDELGFELDQLARPRQAALASAVSFATGAVVPLLAIALAPAVLGGFGRCPQAPPDQRPTRRWISAHVWLSRR
jgi:vacuolar iron transporter family protein